MDLRATVLALTIMVGATPGAAQDGEAETPQSQDIVVTGERPPPRCRPLEGDPLTQVQSGAPAGHWVRIEPDPGGSGYRYITAEGRSVENSSLTDPGEWRRAGNALPSFNFRIPNDGTPLCMGRKDGAPAGDVQLQQLLRPDEYLCRHVRFTAFAASRRASAVIWLNGRTDVAIDRGAAIRANFRGDNRWTPIKLEDGVVPFDTPWVGLGVILSAGDVWIFDPELTIVPEAELSESARRLEADCRDKARRTCARTPNHAAESGDMASRCIAISRKTTSADQLS